MYIAVFWYNGKSVLHIEELYSSSTIYMQAACSCTELQMEHYITQETKHFQNVMLVGMASEISKNYTDIQVCGLLKTQRNQF